MLGTFILTLYNDSGRKMRNTHCRRRLVDMLSAGSAGSVRIDPQIVFVDLDLDLILDIRDHIAGHKGSLTFSRRIEWGDPHKTVNAFFGAQIPVGIFTAHLKRHTFDPCHITLQIIQHFHSKSFLLCPTGIHPVQHTCPVTGLGSAGSRMNAHDRIIPVILSGQKRSDPQFFKLFLKPLQIFPDLFDRLVIRFFLAHLDQKPDILVIYIHFFNFFHGILKTSEQLHCMLRFFRVIPEVRFLDLPFQFLNPFFL